jgi:hypothetical protein
MAATTVVTSSSARLAVDAHRLPAVTFWPTTISRSNIESVSRALRPQTQPAVMIPDAPLEVRAATTASGIAPRGLGSFELNVWVFNPQTGTVIIHLGPLHPGGWAYRASLRAACPGGCRLVGVGALPASNGPAPSTGTIHLQLTGVATRSRSGRWTSVAADLAPRGWRATVGGVHVRSAAPGSLVFAIPASAAATAAGATAPPMAVVADAPATLPAAVTSEAETLNGASPSHGTVPAQGLDGSTLEVRPVATVSALPRLGGDAVMVDLGLLSRLQSEATIFDISDQVWLGPAAPANAIARLQAAGLRINDVQRASALLKQAQRSGPALADDFLLVATIAALLVAAASTLGVLGTTIRQRATELAAFEVAGVSRRSLAGSLAVEAGVLAVTTVTGLAAGILAAALAIPSLPELTGAAPFPLQYVLPAGLLAAVSTAVLAIVLIASAAVGVVVVTRSSPLLLRTAPDDTAA